MAKRTDIQTIKYVIILFFFPFSFASAQTQDSTDFLQNTAIPDTNTVTSDTNTAVFDADNVFPPKNENVVSEAKNVISDTAKTKVHSPKKAAWMSAVLPGLGQAYNKKYWKIPLVYGVIGGLGFGIYYNYAYFAEYRNEYRNRLNGKPARIEFRNPFKDEMLPMAGDNENINATKQVYQRRMELFIIFTAVGYLFNIVDAVVDAHLTGFDVSDNLSLNFYPSIHLNNNPLAPYTTPTPILNFTFTLNFK